MKKDKDFALSNAEYLMKRVWTIHYMDKQDSYVRMNIKDMLHHMRQLYGNSTEAQPDLAVCKTENCRLFIDGNNAGVTVSMSLGGEAEFLLGYEVQLLPVKKWTSSEIELRDSILNGRLLKDYFSDLKLDSSFKIK